MKKRMQAAAALVLALVLLGAAFWAGGQAERRKNQDRDEHDCLLLLSFARGIVEKDDLSDDFTMESLISQVYGAWCFCDKENDADAAGKLYDLWNALMRDGVSDRETVLRQLDHIREMIRPSGE